MSYSSNSFLKPIGSDKSIRFFDNDGNLTFTLKPTFITDVTPDANLLKVTLKSGKIITLDFINFDDTIIAQIKLNQQISTLLQTNEYTDNSTQGVVGYVTAPFSHNTFLRPITESDRNIKIMGVDLIVKYTVDPFYIINTNVSNNLLKISLKSNKGITLEFSTFNESKLALIRLREQIDILTTKSPILIDKNIQNYIQTQIKQVETIIGPTGPQGLTGSADRYSATSSTTFETPIVGQVVDLVTQTDLAYTTAQNVVIYSDLPNLYNFDYEVDGSYFIGQIDNYDSETGDMSLVTTFSSGSGTYNFWYLNLSGMIPDNVTGSLNIGSTTNAVTSAILEVTSTTQGILPPRMTNTQRLGIASPAIGLIVYCTDVTEGLYINKSTGWTFIT